LRRKHRLCWLRRASQLLALALFLYLFFATAFWYIGNIPVNAFFRLDPWVGLLAMVASRQLIASFAWAVLVLVLTLAFGRAWCGWLCPLGTTIELSGGQSRGRLPGRLWALKYVVAAGALGTAALASLSLALLDPITVLFRALALSLLPALDWALTRLESLLFQVGALQGALVAFEEMTRGRIIPYGEASFRLGLSFFIFFVGILFLNQMRPRFWCRYICPLGAFLGLTSKVAVVRRRVDERCIDCGRCQRMCPTAAIAGKEADFKSDAAECIMCLECEALCPVQAISFGVPGSMWPDALYSPSRRLVLGSLVGGVLWGLLGKPKPSQGGSLGLPVIRPPGAQGADFLGRCIRCGECMKVCPTAGLRPALLEAGLEGFWTPVLVPRLGYCEYACNSCGLVCPSGAIRTLPLAVKQEVVLGKASIDRTRCVAWADNTPCGVCEEVCPIPDKAIRLQAGQGRGGGGGGRVPRPVMIEERCIGCGLCEYKCPVEGESAIRVGIRFPGEGEEED